MSSKRKYPGVTKNPIKDIENQKPIKKVNKGMNMFSFFKPKNSQSQIDSQISKKNSQISIEKTPNKNKSESKEVKPKNGNIKNMLVNKNEIKITPKKETKKKVEVEVDIQPIMKMESNNFKDLDLPMFCLTKEASYKVFKLADEIAEKKDIKVLAKTFWSTGFYSQPLPYFIISETLEAVSMQSGNNSVQFKKTILSNLLYEAVKQSPWEVLTMYNILTCRFDADFIQKDPGIGQETLLKAVNKLTGKGISNLRAKFKKLGDLGTLASQCKAGQGMINSFFLSKKKKDLNLKLTQNYIFNTLKSLADIGKNLIIMCV